MFALDLPRIRADVAHFRSLNQAKAPDPELARARTRAALREALARAPSMPPLPRIESALDVERFVPHLRYLLALLKAAGVDEML